MIIILGESASGKSTVQDILCKKYGYERLITCTTRSPRVGEINGVDYYFITESDFNEMNKNHLFCEVAEYNSWHYATLSSECSDNKISVLTPHGLRQLKKLNDLNIISFYLNVPRRNRLIKILQRGDNIEEAYRRSLSDVGQFDGISDEVDFVIHNEGYTKTPEEIAKEIMNKLKEKIK